MGLRPIRFGTARESSAIQSDEKMVSGMINSPILESLRHVRMAVVTPFMSPDL